MEETNIRSVEDAVNVSAPTEDRNPASVHIDRLPTLEVLQLLNAEDSTVPTAVSAVLPELARLVDAAVVRIRAGGGVHYFGAGTSGRLAVLDAAELMPTFNSPVGLFTAHHAGGAVALLSAIENVEDDEEAGRREAQILRSGDVVIGLTASGRTPYVRGALTVGRERGALTALVTAHSESEIGALADFVIAPATGPDVVATNAKLRGRVVRILREATGVDEESAQKALAEAGNELKPALLHLLTDIPAAEARALLDAHGGSVAAALGAIPPTR